MAKTPRARTPTAIAPPPADATLAGVSPADASDGTSQGEVTRLLRAWRGGDAVAHEELLRRVYDELKRVAASQLRGARGGPTLQPTALVHEAFMRLGAQTRVDWQDRRHFFALASPPMRRVLVDHARARLADKRAHQ